MAHLENEKRETAEREAAKEKEAAKREAARDLAVTAEIDEVRQMKSLHPSRASSFYAGTPRAGPAYQYKAL